MKDVKKNNVIIVMFIVVLTMVIGIGLSYAFFSSRISGEESESTIVMEAGSLSIEYADLSNAITVSKIYPKEDAWVTKEFKVTGKNTTDLVLFYKIKIVLDNNEFEGLGLSYSLESKNTGNNGNIIPSISKEYIGKDDVNLGQGYFVNTGSTSKEHKYTLKIYFKNNGEDQNYLQGAKFAAHIEIEAGDKAVTLTPEGWDEAGSGTLLAGIKANYPTVMQPLTNPGKEASSSSEAVLAGAVDDYGMSYYFRGNVANNYVQFANKCWRIVRVTGDGSIKLVLHNDNVNNVASPCASSNNSTSAAFARYSGTTYTTAFNDKRDDNAYVGFKYGTAGSRTYAETHANINKSTILQNLETWYKNNLATYESKLADTIWCNDKSTKLNQTVITTSLNTTTNKLNKSVGNYPGLGYGTNLTLYSGRQRVRTNYYYTDTSSKQYGTVGTGPTLICPLDNDDGKLSKFTVSDTIYGNGALDYKVGLLTVDEVLYAGSIDYHGYQALNYNYSTINSYLRENATSTWYWSFSPYNFDGLAYVLYVGGSGIVGNYWVTDTSGLRPAVSLTSATTISGGNGTSSNPFVIN